MKRWEYLAVESEGMTFMTAELNKHASDGWELVSVAHAHYLGGVGGGEVRLGLDEQSFSTAYFKRESNAAVSQ